QQVEEIRALGEMGTSHADVLGQYLKAGQDARLRSEAVNALAAAKNEQASALLIQSWSSLNASQRRTAMSGILSSKAGATQLVSAVKSGNFVKGDLDRNSMQRLLAVLPGNAEALALVEQMSALFKPVLHLDGKDDAWVDSDISLAPTFTVETWIKLSPGIDNNDGILGAPNSVDMNFYGSTFRVWVAGMNDVVVAKKKMNPELWTHLAVSRTDQGKLKIYINGELDSESRNAVLNKFEHLKIGWTAPNKGTEGDFGEFRVWNRERTPEEIRTWFDRTFEGEAKPANLQNFYTGSSWEKLHGSAKIVKTDDSPLLLTTKEATVQEEKFARARALASKPGESGRGKTLFSSTCMICHSVGGVGAQIGPVLNGAGAMGLEALLRAIITPNAAMEAGYRTFRIETREGDVLDGFLVSQDKDAVVLRQPNRPDQRIAQDKIIRADYTKTSLMPEGLIDSLPERDVSDLFAYLNTLK
ncbi:MAG: hypothetical protein JWM04_2313, partial [Verrucomicrobiales bacterium]|nr:hypothetical protein [Verrucomicrobiales bacterium]